MTTARDSYRPLLVLAISLVCLLLAGTAHASEAGPGFRTDLGLIGGVLDFLGSHPFVLLFTTLAIGTQLGRVKIGFFSFGSSAATLLVGIAFSLWAYLGYNIRYAVPGILTTVFLNFFMFAVGLKVGPQFFAGLKRDGAKGVGIAVIVVGLNFIIVIGGTRIAGFTNGLPSGLISASMTDTAVIGVATTAVENGSFKPPQGVTPAEVTGNIAAAYAVTFPFSLIAMILIVRYLPRILHIDVKAAARAAEQNLGGGDNRLPRSGTEAAYTLKRISVDVRAYRVEMDEVVGLTVHDFSIRADAPVLQVLRGNDVLDLAANPVIQKGDVITVVTDVGRLVSGAQGRIGPEVADERARGVDLEVADLVITRKEFDGLTAQEAVDRVRRALSPGVERVGRLFHQIALIRDGEQLPVWPGFKITRGDILRIIGQKSRIKEVGKLVGATVQSTTQSDIFTLALGLAIGYVVGTLRVMVGQIPLSLGAPVGVMLSGIVISTLRSRNPLFGGPVSEGARSLLQTLGLDVFIAVVVLNSGPSVAGAFTGGTVSTLLAIGIVASVLPSLVAWVVGRRLLKLNPAILLGNDVRRPAFHPRAQGRRGGMRKCGPRSRLSGGVCDLFHPGSHFRLPGLVPVAS